MSRRSRSPSYRRKDNGYSARQLNSRDKERDDDLGSRDERWPGRDRDRDREHDVNRYRDRDQARDRIGGRDDRDRNREVGGARYRERHQQDDYGRSRRDHDNRELYSDDPRNGRGPGPERGRDRSRERDIARGRDRGPPDRRSPSPRSRPRSTRPPSRSGVGSRASSPVDKSQPVFAPSGLLAAATNTVKGADGASTILKYNEPPDARKPTLGWRLYVFKGSEQVEMLHIHRQSAYLIGRDKLVADIAIDHPSCSKQHAAIQYRQVHEKDELGNARPVVKPYIIDLESTNGTRVNDNLIPTSRFYELGLGDIIKFGQSTKEYVLLHDAADQA